VFNIPDPDGYLPALEVKDVVEVMALAESCEPINILLRLLTVVSQNIEDEVSSWLPLNSEHGNECKAKK